MMNGVTSSFPSREKQTPSMATSPGYPATTTTSTSYPGYPPHAPCTGYPDSSYHHNNAYYASSHLPHMYQDPKRGHSIARVVLCFVTMLFIIVTSMSLLFWAIFGSNIPHFTVDSMSVPSFEATNSTLHAIWEAKLAVLNPNKRLKVSLEHIEGRLVYNDILMDVIKMHPILNLNSNEQRIISADFVVPSPDYDSSSSSLFQQIEEDRKKGSVLFSLRFVTTATYNSGKFWRSKTHLAIICDGLQVQFPAPTGGGKWNGKEQGCFIIV